MFNCLKDSICMDKIAESPWIGGFLGALIAIGIITLIIIVVVVWVYNSLTWMKIAKKQKYKHPWLAWIPIANWAMILEMGGFHWAWVFLILLIGIGWIPLLVLLTISLWKIFEKARYPGWLSLSNPLRIVPFLSAAAWVIYLVVIGLVAWKKR
jgi:hypothetical protein